MFEAKYTAEAWDDLPAHYVAQVQWQLHVTGLPAAWVAALQFPFGRPRFTIFELAADAGHQAELTAAAETFWNDHVVTGNPPPLDDHRATTAAITAAWGGLDTVKVPTVDFDELRDVVDEYAELDKKRKSASTS